ncbi:MAG: MFS transporter [Dehalococcoidia bacterium]
MVTISRTRPVTLAAVSPAVAPPKPPPAFLQALGIGAFRRLLASNGLAFMGKYIQNIIVAWLVLEMTDSNFWVGIVNGVPALSIVLFSLFGGVLADRMDRRTLLMWSRVSLASLSFLSAFLIAAGIIELWHLVAIVMLVMGLHAIDEAVGRTLAGMIVGKERLLSANSMTTLVRNLGTVVGPAVIGVLMARYGPSAGLYLMAGTYLTAFLTLFLIQSQGAGEQKKQIRVLGDLVDGFKYVRRNSCLTWLIGLAFTVPLAGVYFAMLPVYAREVLLVGSEGLGLLVGIYSLGGLLGSLFLTLRSNVGHKGWLVLGSGLTYVAGMLVVAFSHSFALSLLATFIVGVAAMLWINTMTTLVQSQAINEMQGRVMSLFGLGLQLHALGWLIGGMLGIVFGYQGAMVIAGAVFVGVHLFAFAWSQQLRHID